MSDQAWSLVLKLNLGDHESNIIHGKLSMLCIKHTRKNTVCDPIDIILENAKKSTVTVDLYLDGIVDGISVVAWG